MQLQAIYITSVHAVGQGWVALLTDVGTHVACRGYNRLWAMVVRCIVGVFDLTHAHLASGDCTHGVRVTTVYG